ITLMQKTIRSQGGANRIVKSRAAELGPTLGVATTSDQHRSIGEQSRGVPVERQKSQRQTSPGKCAAHRIIEFGVGGEYPIVRSGEENLAIGEQRGCLSKA